MTIYHVKIDFIYSAGPFDSSDRPPTFYLEGDCEPVTAGRVLKELLPYIEFIRDNNMNNLDEFAKSRGELSTYEAYSARPKSKQYSLIVMLDAIGPYTYGGDGRVILNNYQITQKEIENELRNIIATIEDGGSWIEYESDLTSTIRFHTSGTQSGIDDY